MRFELELMVKVSSSKFTDGESIFLCQIGCVYKNDPDLFPSRGRRTFERSVGESRLNHGYALHPTFAVRLPMTRWF